jgi:hypothetical protein
VASINDWFHKRANVTLNGSYISPFMKPIVNGCHMTFIIRYRRKIELDYAASVLTKQLIVRNTYKPFSSISFRNRKRKVDSMAGFGKTRALPTMCIYAGFSQCLRDQNYQLWPACLPDLNSCDFLFWGCLTDKVTPNRKTKSK